MASVNYRNAMPLRVPDVPGAAQRDWLTLIFVVISLSVAMSVRQEYNPEQSQIEYLLFVAPAILIPLARPLSLVEAIRGKAWLLIAFLVTAGSWHLLRGDTVASYQIALFILVYVWHNSPDVRLLEADLTRLYLALIAVGAALWLTVGTNLWGLIPGTTVTEYGIWRVSFFPNIAFTAFFSLIVLCLKLRSGWAVAVRQPSFWVALYFLTFSFVRTALVGFLILVILQAWYRRPHSPAFLFWTSLLTAISVNIFIAYSATLFLQLQDLPIVSRLFLRGEVGLSEYEIYVQLYRPWLWGEHLHQFWTSPYMMGWGSVEFQTLVRESLVANLEQNDTVSTPTRLLAQDGLAGILFIFYLLACLWERAKARDRWACAVFPVVFLGLLQWGSLFHPTDAMGLLMMLMLVKGSAAFPVRAVGRLSPEVAPGSPLYGKVSAAVSGRGR